MSEYAEHGESLPLTPFERNVFSDFKLSFLHSQGGDQTQNKMFVYFAMSYPKDPDITIPTLRSHIQEKVDNLSLPNRHTEKARYKNPQFSDEGTITSQDIRAEFDRCWKQYADILEYRMQGRGVLNSTMIQAFKAYTHNPEEFPLIVSTDILNRDLYFQKIGRPHAPTDEKRWESLAKKHVVDGISTGNERIDHLYQQAVPFLERAKAFDPKTVFDDVSAGDNMIITLSDLANEWDRHHPGKSFFEAD